MNRISRSPARLREPGKVRTGAYAGIEWTWEPPTESPFTGAVGLDGVGTVIRARGRRELLAKFALSASQRCRRAFGGFHERPKANEGGTADS